MLLKVGITYLTYNDDKVQITHDAKNGTKQPFYSADSQLWYTSSGVAFQYDKNGENLRCEYLGIYGTSKTLGDKHGN